MKLNRKWTVFLIHHSHTDIGYTERQDKITRYHCDYIKQAIDILDSLHSGKCPQYKGFVWQCENYWQVENFCRHADERYRSSFEKYLKSGEIGFSANYLNMTELIAYDVLSEKLGEAKSYAERVGIKSACGMSADINGFAWGYPDALYENGIENFFSCLHPHHGMFPLYKKQMPFYWVTPKGNRVLFWNGEHYHIGNEMHFPPLGGNTYMTLDDVHKQISEGSVKRISAADTEVTENAILEKRLSRYLVNLEKEGYEYDFVPMMVSGVITDNAPPSGELARRATELSERYGDTLTVKMVTLEQFFDHVRSSCKEIPSYSGDWSDWWADGVGSTPAPVKVFRDAQRRLSICKKLDPTGEAGDEALRKAAVENLMLYAEHTWGYSSSVIEPWETLVGDLELKKTAYAVNANTAAAGNLDVILAAEGEVSCRYNRPQQFAVINPHSIDLTAKVCLHVEFWEYLDGVVFDLNTPFEVVDCASGKVRSHQIVRIARAYQIEILAELKAGERREVFLRRTDRQNDYTIENHPYVGAEAVRDLAPISGYEESTRRIETDTLIVTFDRTRGIDSIIDKKTGNNLVRTTEYAPFTGVYEFTPMQVDARETRRRMGRNRKSEYTRRHTAQLNGMEIVENGDIYIAVKLEYTLEGMQFYTLFLKLYKSLPKLEVMVRLHKDSVWEPENLYISLPFTTGQQESCYIDKTGCFIRPGIDQLPGSGKEFYLLQNGIVYLGETRNVTLSIKDAPLVTFGSLASYPIELCTGENRDLNLSPAFSWVMNNYWETNFKVDLGGFYEFAYSLTVGEREPAELAFLRCESYNEGLLGCYI